MTTYDDQYHVSGMHPQFKAKLPHPYLVCIQDSQVSMLLAYSTFGNIFSIEEEGIGLFRTMDWLYHAFHVETYEGALTEQRNGSFAIYTLFKYS